MRTVSIASSLLLLFSVASSADAHLGEEHPAGQHRYFPDVPDSEVTLGVEAVGNTTGSWWTDAHHVPGSADKLILGNRFQSQFMVTESGKHLYLKTGEDYRWTVEGMSAFEFHPGFNDPESPGYGKFYTITSEVDSTETPDFVSGVETVLHNVLHEWTASDIASDVFSGAQRELLRFQESSRFHNVNDLEFGSDGTLFIALGEDEQNTSAADLGSVFGKILRIDPLGSNSANGNYGIPADNPFVDDPHASDEIYAYGLRNPWRITIDSENGDMWAFDVGAGSIEEVSKIVAGGNYGWPVKEGSMLAAREAFPDTPDSITGKTRAEQDGLIDPVFEYDHLQGVSVVGGLVYRGAEFPWLQGKIIFADVGVGTVSTPAPRIFYGDPDTGEMFELVSQETIDSVWGKTCIAYEQRVSCPIYSINEDANGEILVLGKSVMRLVSLHDDFNGDGSLDAIDINLLTEQVLAGSGNLTYDVNGDGEVNGGDRIAWVEGRAQTYLGDANLDGRFDTLDLIKAFQAGEYEDDIVRNSVWETGDWNGDREFTTSDLILVAASGGYNANPRTSAVPEPGGLALSITGALALYAACWASRDGRQANR